MKNDTPEIEDESDCKGDLNSCDRSCNLSNHTKEKYLYWCKNGMPDLPAQNDWDEQKDIDVVDWRRARQVLEHEDNLLLERAKLLLASQTVLTAFYYFVFQSGEIGKDGFQLVGLIVISSFGCILAVFIALGMRAARIHQRKIIKWWHFRFGYEKNSEWLPGRMTRQPPIAGNDPEFFYISDIPYSIVAWVIFVLWVCVLGYSFSLLSKSENDFPKNGTDVIGNVILIDPGSAGENYVCIRSTIFEEPSQSQLICQALEMR